ncbi:hypothetical protein CTAYLR_007625 [Chrysophaeum taylorii]|uniref:VHS domain-containing protein n=1 Tax=Chrysophaeum taylorii TaxID=2483200 RepID=A0AAD7XQ38_9STRA|nr:hypothetical protein CTAYLR_007625 [Chrysophaeum taylorii]
MEEVSETVNRATSEILDGMVDWGMNLEICDSVSANKTAIPMVGAVQRRLLVRDPKVQSLALTLIETCVKNCGREVHAAVGTREFLGTVAKVAETSAAPATRESALSLIQQWGVAFEGLQHSEFPCFAETYAALKVKGLVFPELTADAPVFTPPAAEDGLAAALQKEEEEAAMRKLKGDLDAVAEKVLLCNEMVPLSEGIDHDDALAEIVGFLEACRPRMLDLIEAGSRGALSDDILAMALKVNDDLAKALEYEKNHAANPDLPPPKVESTPRLDIGDDDNQDDEDDDAHALSRGKPTAHTTDLLDLNALDDTPPPV